MIWGVIAVGLGGAILGFLLGRTIYRKPAAPPLRALPTAGDIVEMKRKQDAAIDKAYDEKRKAALTAKGKNDLLDD